MSSKKPKLPGGAVDRLGATYQYLLGKKKDPSSAGVGTTLNREVRDALVPDQLRREMAEILYKVSQLGLCVGGINEASLQVGENQFLVTRQDCWFQDLVEDDLILALANSGHVFESEKMPLHWGWHMAAYQTNSNVKAVIYGQPAAVLALAGKGILPQKDNLIAAAEYLGAFSLCQPKTEEINNKFQKNQMLILPGAGVLSLGESLTEAAVKLELINRLGEITLLAG
jgi:ribulose-5-phosphate 4-epimerase/fuculose-1-phosphate aldolase